MSLIDTAVSGPHVYRIRNWHEVVSRGKSTRTVGSLGRLSAVLLGPVSGLKGLVRRRLLKLPHGVAAYGVWILLAAIASETSVPGTFLDGDLPLTLDDLSLLTDVPADELRTALETLSRPDIRLIEHVSLEEALATPDGQSEPQLQIVSVPNEIQFSSSVVPVAVHEQPRPTPVSPVPGPEAHVETLTPRQDQVSVVAAESNCPALANAPALALSSRQATPTATPSSQQEIAATEEQVARLAGLVNQVEQLKRQTAVLANEKPILTAGRKGRPNGWKVNATLNPGKK